MAVKVKTNKKQPKNIVKTKPSDVMPIHEKPTYNVEPIENGFIVTKSWSDEKGYHTKKRYHETNPLEDANV